MYRKIALAGATAAAIVGVGTAALATSGTSGTTNGSGTTPATGTSSSATHSGQPAGKHNGKHGHRGAKLRMLLRRVDHGSLVTKGKDGFVTHSGIRGTVTTVSSTAITVKAADGYTETFTLNAKTKVLKRAAGTSSTTGHKRAAKSSISAVKTGDKVGVLGVAPDKAGATPTASVVVDGLTK